MELDVALCSEILYHFAFDEIATSPDAALFEQRIGPHPHHRIRLDITRGTVDLEDFVTACEAGGLSENAVMEELSARRGG